MGKSYPPKIHRFKKAKVALCGRIDIYGDIPLAKNSDEVTCFVCKELEKFNSNEVPTYRIGVHGKAKDHYENNDAS